MSTTGMGGPRDVGPTGTTTTTTSTTGTTGITGTTHTTGTPPGTAGTTGTSPTTGTSGTSGMGSSGSTTDEAKAQANNLAGASREEAASVAEEAKTQARNVVDDARTMMDEQTRTQRDRVVESARTFSGDLEQMADAGPDGMAGDVARQVAEKIRSFSERMDGREPSDLLDDVRDFARRRPGIFLLGALGAGVVVGRMARGAKDAQSSSAASPTPTTSTTRTSSFATTGTSTPATSTAESGRAYVPGLPIAGEPAEVAVPDSGFGTKPHGDPLSASGDSFASTDTPLGDEARRSL